MKPEQETKGRHIFDPEHCSRCWEMANDEVWTRARQIMKLPELVGIELEHGEVEYM